MVNQNPTVYQRIRSNTITPMTIDSTFEENHEWFSTKKLKVVMIDTVAGLDPLLVGVVLLPPGKEVDFFTANNVGLRQLASSFNGLSRLFVVSNMVEELDFEFTQVDITKSFQLGVQPTVKKLLEPYYPLGFKVDNIMFFSLPEPCVSRVVVATGSYNSANYVITDDIVEGYSKNFHCIRRLRFLESGNYVHAEIRMILKDGELAFDLDYFMDDHYRLCYIAVNKLRELKRKKYQVFKGKKKLLSLGGFGGACFYKKMKHGVNVDCFWINTLNEDAKLIMRSLGMEVEGVSLKTYNVHPYLALDRFEDPENKDSFIEDLEHFYKENAKGFDFVLVDCKELSDGGQYLSPADYLVEGKCVKRLKNILQHDGILIMHFDPSSCFKTADALHQLEKEFHNILKVNITDSANFLVIATASPDDVDVIHLLSQNLRAFSC